MQRRRGRRFLFWAIWCWRRPSPCANKPEIEKRRKEAFCAATSLNSTWSLFASIEAAASSSLVRVSFRAKVTLLFLPSGRITRGSIANLKEGPPPFSLHQNSSRRENAHTKHRSETHSRTRWERRKSSRTDSVFPGLKTLVEKLSCLTSFTPYRAT